MNEAKRRRMRNLLINKNTQGPVVFLVILELISLINICLLIDYKKTKLNILVFLYIL